MALNFLLVFVMQLNFMFISSYEVVVEIKNITVVSRVSAHGHLNIYNSRFWPAWALTRDKKLLQRPLELGYMGTYPGVHGRLPGTLLCYFSYDPYNITE